MHDLKLLSIVLDLFDGEGAGDGAPGETPSAAGKGKGEFANVVYGKQLDAEATEDTEQAGDADQQKAPEKVPFKDLINGEYKQEFDEIFKRRLKDHKELQKTVADTQGVLDMLYGKYNVQDIESLTKAIEDDDAMWESAAYEAGMTTDQYKQYQKLQRENNKLRAEHQEAIRAEQAQKQVEQWQVEAMQLKAQFPNFDLEAELLNKDFADMLTRGISMDAAYKVTHFNDLMQNTAYNVATATEKKVTDNIRAKGSRPVENGTTSQSAFTIKNDPSKWTKKDRAEIARRVARGETIIP